MKNNYDNGRLNLPFVGIATFGKYPYQQNWDNIDADVAILGAPFDFGSQFRSGARMGPRGIREASTLFSFGHAGAYDHEDDITYLPSDSSKIVDLGDADIIHTDTINSHKNIKDGVKKIKICGAENPDFGNYLGYVSDEELNNLYNSTQFLILGCQLSWHS